MNELPLVSVCLITFNQDGFIRNAIEGVLNQKTKFKFELVVGDDCSTDNNIRIIDEYAQAYPNIITFNKSESNVGLNENFLKTFRLCRGKYIAYLEGDDYWVDMHKLQRQVDILEARPEVSLVHTNCRLWEVESGKIINQFIPDTGVCVRETAFGQKSVIAEFENKMRPIKTSTCCYRSGLLSKIIDADEYAYCNKEFPTQDFQLFLDMSMEGVFAYINDDTTVIGNHVSLSSGQDYMKKMQFYLGCYKIGLHYINKYKLPQATIQIWMSRKIHYFMNNCFLHNDKYTAIYVINEALKNNYRISARQKCLYFGVRYPSIRFVILPFYCLYIKRFTRNDKLHRN
ncbi:MAG: glycosyltransferase [Chlorobiaceae bacterium]